MNLSLAIRTVRQLGLRTAIQRIVNAVKVRSGYIAWIDPAQTFDIDDLNKHFRNGESVSTALDRLRSERFGFFYHPADLDRRRDAIRALMSDADVQSLLTRVEALDKGVVWFFSHASFEMGTPINWRLNPVTGVTWSNEQHWSRYSQLDPRMGDIKLVWEANRFAFLYDLVRAHTLTGDARWIDVGLRWIESWIDANPPAQGPNWICGQEISFRLMAWCFFLRAAAPVLDVDRFGGILASIYRQTQRVERYIGFARSIRNNHAFSEAIGLYTTGVLFPGFDRTSKWRHKGRRILTAEAAYQIFDDGTYIQHSMNYHRLMLSDCLWAVRLGQLHGDTFPAAFRRRLEKATDFLRQMIDPESGRVPNYGANDGAQVLPLTSCDYLDYRPIVQALGLLLRNERYFDSGPADEILIWMLGHDASDATRADASQTSRSFETGGYYQLRGKTSWGMVRCHTYVERPSQADMLHFDLWWRGLNILRDSGSYSYNCDAPWQDYFKSTSAHNTIAVKGQSQMVKGPRFMWFDWTQSRFLGWSPPAEGAGETWLGEHDGYVSRFGVVHRREIECCDDDRWRITDTLQGDGATSGILSWQLIDCPFEFEADDRGLRLTTTRGIVRIRIEAERDVVEKFEVVRGEMDKGSCAGWESLYYSEKSPIPVLRVSLSGEMPIRVTTLVELDAQGNDAP